MLRGRLFGKPVTALADVSFAIEPGEIACVMGPNGAGKSTLVRILGGLLLPTSGRARVAGIDAGAGTAEFRRRVAFVVGDERSFHYRVTGRGNLHYFAALHGLPIAIKDLAATRGLRTTLGTPLFADFVPDADAIAVARVRAAGAIIIGKTNTPEFGLGSHTFNPLFGATRNAFDQQLTLRELFPLLAEGGWYFIEDLD